MKYPNTYFKLFLCKGVFPYDYLDSFEKFNELALPNRDAFFSTLRGEECQYMTLITQNAYGQLSDATLLKTISNTTWQAMCAN